MERTSDVAMEPLLLEDASLSDSPHSSMHDESPLNMIEVAASPDPETPNAGVTRRLYFSHFLSTFNSRVFELGAVLFIARMFPSTLLPISIYALTRAAAAVGLSSLVGQYIDENDRLKVVRLSIGT